MERIPKSHLCNDILLCHSDWISQLLATRTVPETFTCHTQFDEYEVEAYLRQKNVSPLISDDYHWEVFSIDKYPRKSSSVFPICADQQSSTIDYEEATFAEVLEYVSHNSFTDQWQDALSKYSQAWNVRGEQHSNVFGRDWDRALLDVLVKTYQCPIIDTTGSSLILPSAESLQPDEKQPHLPLGLAIVVGMAEVMVLRPFTFSSLQDLMRFSPALIDDSYLKQLFLFYQILVAATSLHSRRIFIGSLTLNDIFVDETYHITLKPHCLDNLKTLEIRTFQDGYDNMDPSSKELLFGLKAEYDLKGHDNSWPEIFNNFLGQLVQLWSSGEMSNFDYIMFLNYLCGRTFTNPNHYPVIPWVRDFTSQNGGWRDLTKSKYRLNKGDTQLDLTYEVVPHSSSLEKDILSQLTCPHHVSDVLSEITYYVYKSRQTAKSVLCRHVRSRWVPAEYPSSMQRLQEWTPDECIPDFYTDPSLFSSIHEDLPDLGIPSWCSTPEDFITWHRASLESDQVSERLHCWIDLTFGYKLAGSSAVRAKNVCLPLIDNHIDLRISGVVQLFSHPHPSRKLQSPFWSRSMMPKIDQIFQNVPADDDSDNEVTDDNPDGFLFGGVTTTTTLPIMQTNISLPKEFDSLAILNDFDAISMFAAKSNTGLGTAKPTEKNSGINIIEKSRLEKANVSVAADMQVIGCIVMEIFVPKKFLSLGRCADLKSRVEACLNLLLRPDQLSSVPFMIRDLAIQLLRPESALNSQIGDNNCGVIHLTPSDILTPLLSSVSFPSYFSAFARLLRQLREIDRTITDSRRKNLEKWKELETTVLPVISEMKVKLVASVIEALGETDLKTEDMNLILPCIKKLFKDKVTSVMAAWHLLDPVSKILGPDLSASHFLESILRIYESGTPTAKHLKLYHRSFLLSLIVNFGLKVFLRYFIGNLIEAVGGYKDIDYPPVADELEGLEKNWDLGENDECEETCKDFESKIKSETLSPLADFSEGDVFPFEEAGSSTGVPFSEEIFQKDDLKFDDDLDSVLGPIYVPSSYDDLVDASSESKAGSVTKVRSDGNISQIAAESVLWLAHRLGPFLTAKYLSRNLLKMLNLCYVGSKSSTLASNEQFADSYVRISNKRTEGDAMADNVLECLSELACLYGEHFILSQYFSYALEMVESCQGKKSLGWSTEGGLLGCLAMIRHCVTCLSDSVLMKELSENLLSRIFHPILKIITSTNISFFSGANHRQMMAFKLLDTIYVIGLRIGEEMARALLSDICVELLASFDKVHAHHQTPKDDISGPRTQVMQVLTSNLAYAVYVTFFHLLGRAHLDRIVPNINVLRKICSGFNERNTIRVATFAHLRGGLVNKLHDLSPGGSSSGNMIGIIDSHYNQKGLPDFSAMIKKEISATSRHLRGNWLTYWEHEITKFDSGGFELKQLKLQSFTGHTAGVRHIHVLDNENSFLSGSRDKTVKVWSLRSRGDGNEVLGSQWTYNLHKKSINSLSFLDSLRLVASCDSNIHIWDPFVGSGVHQIEGSTNSRLGGPVSVMASLTPFSQNLILAATPHDGLLHVIECRVGQVVIDLKICLGSAGLVRCICTDPSDPNTITVGHSSGLISQLDIRTGKLKQAWKAHEGEILSLTSVKGGDFISSSLDQAVHYWDGSDAKLISTLNGSGEPVNCVSTNGEEVITATNSNRIMIRRGAHFDIPLSSTRLKPEVLRGSLLSMKLLTLNRFLLVGTDSGNISLIC